MFTGINISRSSQLTAKPKNCTICKSLCENWMMDPKASAKAKRSHTQQGKKSHPTPASIAQKKKKAQVASEEKVRQPHFQNLLSNWDRYDEGMEEDGGKDGTILSEGEFASKSKGADFAYLIEQARSQQPETEVAADSESLLFFDELTLDFMQGVRSIHTIRGKSLFSRCEDDNFFVDDDLTPNFEVPFLNLDLHALDEQLSKIKLSDRLFIEEDLFPEDLLSEVSKDSSSSLQSDTLRMIDVGKTRDDASSIPSSSLNDAIVPTQEDFSHSDFSRTYPFEDNVQGFAREDEESLANTSKNSVLKVEEAEAELDFLLESFKEASLSGSIQDDLKPASKVSSYGSTIPMILRQNPMYPGLMDKKQTLEAELESLLSSSKETSPFGSINSCLLDDISTFNAPNLNRTIQEQVSLNSTDPSIDDSIDVLLAETSPTILKMQKYTESRRDKTRPQLHSGSSSVVDFRAGNLVSRVQKSTESPNEAAAGAAASSKLGSRNIIDDFDSWIDSF